MANRNLLQILQEFAKRRSLPIPTAAMSNPDAGVAQMVGIMNELLEDMQTRSFFQRNTFETTFISVAGEDQGDILTLCPYGFEQILWETLFDRTQRLPLIGSVSAAEWQARKAFNVTGPYYNFRLRQNRLLFSPDLPVGHTIAFEYQSSAFVKENNGGGVAYKDEWTNDIDTFTLGDSLPLAWLNWRWNQKKGFDYAEEFRQYEALLAVKSARDDRPQAVDISCRTNDLRPGIYIPSGNWMRP